MKIKFNKYVELLLLWGALGGVVGRQWLMPDITWQIQVELFFLSFFVLNAIWLFHYWFNDYLNRRLPFEKNIKLRVVIQIIGGWGIVKTVYLVISYFVYTELLSAQLTSVPLLNRFSVIIIGMTVFLANTVVCLGFIASHFLKQWQENAIRATQLEKEKIQVQLDSLKNQISPHFLFNSLSSLDGLIHENPDLASQFLRQLSKVFRYVIQHKDKDLVSLTTETDFINNYILLLKTRFNGSLDIQVKIPPAYADKAIVPVTLQILIENAIKHNIANAGQPLTIQIVADKEYVSVENNLQRKPRVETSNGQGLTNLKALYHFLSEKDVKVEEHNDRFRVSVPLV
ncbi:sensor histidine kinase [Larkinella sp. C7]|jgi:two-component system LytT family sensor kinase|uniref:sensor histidine kinase n=1 Tax=Larkinella sp. C7 TaxID=2576607 RepID=UPI00111111ED|nr:histidine kinase [Larkinella sp. C7]